MDATTNTETDALPLARCEICLTASYARAAACQCNLPNYDRTPARRIVHMWETIALDGQDVRTMNEETRERHYAELTRIASLCNPRRYSIVRVSGGWSVRYERLDGTATEITGVMTAAQCAKEIDRRCNALANRYNCTRGRINPLRAASWTQYMR